MTATFPTLTAQDVDKVPTSTHGTDYDDLLTRIKLSAANNGQALIYDGARGLSFAPLLTGQENFALMKALVSNGILEGMVLTKGSADNLFNISAGKYTLKRPNSEEYDVYTFAGVSDQALPASANLTLYYCPYVVVKASSVIEFISPNDLTITQATNRRNSVVVGALKLVAGNINEVFNTGHRLKDSGQQFSDYLNGLGVWSRGIVVGLTAAGKLRNTGGKVYSGTVFKGNLVQASSTQQFRIMDDLGAVSAVQDTLTIAALQKFEPVGGAEQNLTGANNFVIWFVFVSLQGEFFLLKPQRTRTGRTGGQLAGGDVTQEYADAVLPPILQTGTTLVGAIIVGGSAAALTDVVVEDLRSNELSSSEGKSFVAPVVPVAQVFADQEEDAAFNPTGQYQLGKKGADIGFVKGLEAVVNNPDGYVATNMFDSNGPLVTVPTQWGHTGNHIKPQVEYITFAIPAGTPDNSTTITFPVANIIASPLFKPHITGPITLARYSNFAIYSETAGSSGAPSLINVLLAVIPELAANAPAAQTNYAFTVILRHCWKDDAGLPGPLGTPPAKPYLNPLKPNYINKLDLNTPIFYTPAVFLIRSSNISSIRFSAEEHIIPSGSTTDTLHSRNYIETWANNRLSKYIPKTNSPYTTPVELIDNLPATISFVAIKYR